MTTASLQARISLGALLLAHTMSVLACTITVFVIPFLVRALGGGALEVGATSAVATVPIVIGAPLGGLLIDALGARRFSIVSDTVSGLTVFVIAALSGTGRLPLWGLSALLALSGLFDTPGQTARNALIPALARAARTPLERAVGLSAGAERTAALIGAPLAGGLVALLGAPRALFVGAALFGMSIILVASIPAALGRIASDRGDCVTAPASERQNGLMDGLRFVLRQPLLRNVALVLLALNALDAARFSVLLPLYAIDRLGGPAAAGIIGGALAGGAIVASVLFSAWGHRLPRRAVFAISFALTGAPLSAGFFFRAPLGMLVALAAATGLFAGMLNPLIATLRLELTPPGLRARTQGFMIALAWAGTSVGSLLAGVAADRFDLPSIFAAVGVVYVLIALAPLVDRS